MADKPNKFMPDDDAIILDACLDMDDKVSRCVHVLRTPESYKVLIEILCHYICCCEFYALKSPSGRVQRQKCLDDKVEKRLDKSCLAQTQVRYNEDGKPYQKGDGLKNSSIPDIVIGSKDRP